MRDTFAVHVSDPGMHASQMTTKRTFRWAFVETDSRHPLLQACPKGSKHCSNGKCVNQKYVCDDQDDCGDGSDELDCQDRCRFHMNQLNSGQVCLEVKASSMARDLTLVRQVESPGNGGNYAQFSDCKWTLEGPQGTNIVLVVSKIFITRARNEDVSSLILTTAVFSKFLNHFFVFWRFVDFKSNHNALAFWPALADISKLVYTQHKKKINCGCVCKCKADTIFSFAGIPTLNSEA